jgi:hypothetical protein
MDKNKLRSLLNEGKTQNALDNLLEELETKATKKANPELSNPELKNSDVYTKDSHSAVEEVKEVIVESKDLSAKEKMNLLLEKYGVSSMRELAVEERAKFLKELNDPNTKFVKADVLLEADTPQETNAKARETNANAEMMKQKRLAMQNNGPESARVSGQKVNAEVESPENDEIDAEEKELEPEVQANDKDVNDTKDKEGDDTIKQDKKALTKDENIESVNESLESIFDILRDMKPLREEEVTDKGDAAAEPVATDDADAETKEPDTDNEDVYSKEEHNEDEEVEEVVVEEVTSKGEVAKTDNEATKEEDGKSEQPKDDNEDVYPSDEHKEAEEVEEVVVEEVTDKGDAAAKPEATKDGEGTSEEPKDDNEDVYPKDEHEEKEEVEEVVVEGEQLDKANKEVENAGKADKLNDVKSDTLDSKGELVTQPDEVDPEKVQKELIEEEVTSKGEVAKTDNEATDEGKPESEEPKDDNEDVFPADEHKEVEEVEEVVVEDAIQVSENAVFITLPIRENEKFAKELSDKEQEIVTEALKEVYGVFTGKKLNEDFEVPADSEADLKVYKEKIEIELPVSNPSEQITESDAARLQEALEVLDAVLKEMSTAGIAAIDVVNNPTKDAVKGKDDPENADQVDNEDLYADEHKQEDDVEEVVVEEVTSKGDAAHSDNEATKENDGSADAPKDDNADVYPSDEHKEVEEVKEVVVEAEEKKELPEELEKNTKGDKDDEDKVPEKLEDDSKDEDHDEESDDDEKEESEDSVVNEEEVLNPAEEKEKTKKDSDCEVEPEVKNDEVSVKPHDAAGEEGKKVRAEIIEEAEEKEPKSTEELNDAGSDTINNDGELEDPADEKEDEKAQPEDVTEGYKSIKEAFLLEADYFSKDSKVVLTADEKRNKLENQMSLLIARESQDPLYEELVRTTILAKKLQEQLHDRYGEAAKAKSQELVNLKESK